MIPDQFAQDPTAIMAFVTGAVMSATATYAFLMTTHVKMMRAHFAEILSIKDEAIEELKQSIERNQRAKPLPQSTTETN